MSLSSSVAAINAIAYLIVAQPQSGSTAAMYALGDAMLGRSCGQQARHIGSDKHNLTRLDPSFSWAGWGHSDFGNFDEKTLRGWLSSRRCVVKQHILPTPSNMQGMEALAPLVARSAVFLFRDPIEGAKALCTRYGLVNQTLRLQLRVEQLRRFQASWQVLLTRMAAHGLKAPTIYHEDMVANSTRTFLSVASAWNLTTVQLELQANRTHAPLDAPFAVTRKGSKTHYVNSSSRCHTSF